MAMFESSAEIKPGSVSYSLMMCKVVTTSYQLLKHMHRKATQRHDLNANIQATILIRPTVLACALIGRCAVPL